MPGKKQDQEEARRFFDSEYPGLYRYALYLTRNREAAEEICQETFLRWFKITRPEEIERPRAWLNKVCARLAYNYLRHQNLRLRYEAEGLPEEVAGAPVESEIMRLEVEDILRRLSWRDQMLLKLRMAGMRYNEIAEAMELSPGSVGTMLARAMQRFKYEYQGKEAGMIDEVSR